ncbi:antitoxin [Streptomyces sp.]|uniref:antitoxin n=1 Tax=Streptomyces sp. TaxID=1931 RepID=UPI002F41805E
MSFMDTLKGKLGMSKQKAADLAQKHGDKIDTGLDKAGRTIDDKTGGRHSGRIDSGADRAKGAVDDLGDKGGTGSA